MNTQELAAALSASGLRPTPQRLAVYGYLLANRIHPTADMIFQSLRAKYPSFSRTTIYNSLHSLAEVRLIRTVNIEAEEQRFDGNPNDHGHFKCERCGRLYDFNVTPQLLEAVCPPGFQAKCRDIYLTGICAFCGENTPL